MTVLTELVAELEGDSALEAIVGAEIHAGVAPQGTDPPYLVYAVISAPPGPYTLDKTSGLHEVLLQLDAYALTYAQAAAIANAALAAIHDYSSADVQGVFLEDGPATGYVPDGERLHRSTTELRVYTRSLSI